MEMAPADIRLDCAALHLARDVYPHVALAGYLRQLDEIAERVAAERAGLSAPLRYEAMRRVLVDELEFVGNESDYYDPDNSYLNRVLDRRLGLPISLSIIWIEVGRRLKWPVAGVGFPGHFLVRFDDPERFVIADPFGGGRTLTPADCESLLCQYFERDVELSDSFLAPVDTRAILTRLLNNLRGIYRAHQDWHRLRSTLERLIAIEPGNTQYLRDLAATYCELGELRTAQTCLVRCLASSSDAAEEQWLLRSLAQLASVRAHAN